MAQKPDKGPWADPAHAKAGFALIRRIMRGELKGAARVEAFRDMDRRFPNCGWKEAVETLEIEMGM